MKWIKKQINNFLYKPREFQNREIIKENDKIAKKYIDMIYNDFDLNKDLFRASLSDYGNTIDISYNITDSKNGTVYSDISWAHQNVGDIKIHLLLIKNDTTENWHNDITRGRITADIFVPYKGNLNLFGRDMKTKQNVVNKNGIEEDVYDYLNISPKQIEILYDFFKQKYIEKYPFLKGGNAFNPMKVKDKESKISNNKKLGTDYIDFE